jgi:hypothetical protein
VSPAVSLLEEWLFTPSHDTVRQITMTVRPLMSIACSVMATVGILYGAYVFIIVVPRYEMIFKDLGMAIPVVTVLCIQSSRYGLGYGLLAVIPFLMLKELLIGNENVRLTLSFAALALVLMVIGCAQIAMTAPLITIIQSLGHDTHR